MAPRVEIPDTPEELLREIDTATAMLDRERYLRERKMSDILDTVLDVLERYNDEFHYHEGELSLYTRIGSRTGDRGFHGSVLRIRQIDYEGIDPDESTDLIRVEAWEIRGDHPRLVASLDYFDDPADPAEGEPVDTIDLAKVATYLQSSDLTTIDPRRFKEMIAE